MGILCGVDIIEIDRMKRAFENSSGEIFRDKVFTSGEINYCEARKVSRFKSYAARFAAKEAVSKAFGTGISQGIGWKDIEVFNDELGKPHIRLHGSAIEKLKELGGEAIDLSMSHCDNFAVAYVNILTSN